MLALGGDDDNGVDDHDDDLEGSGVPGDELFNRCINATLEAQEVLPAPDLFLPGVPRESVTTESNATCEVCNRNAGNTHLQHSIHIVTENDVPLDGGHSNGTMDTTSSVGMLTSKTTIVGC